jgi:LysM repeat protein
MTKGLNVRASALLCLAALAFLLGHVFGPGPVMAAAPAQNGELITVVVQSGDSLARYARVFGVSGGRLRAANPQLADPNLIRPGQVITIPVVRSFTPSLTTPFFYVVAAGDTLSALGRRFEMEPGLIAQVNGVPGDAITAGQTLLIPAGPHRYTVQRGDTLRRIAERYGVTVAFLLTGNNLPNPDLIFPGQVIFIPIIYDAQPRPITPVEPPAVEPAPTATPGPDPAPAPTPVPGNFIQHTVRTGENFTTYVRRYGVSGAALRVANPQIADPHLIFPGDVVIIPVPVSFTPSRTTPFFHVVEAGETAASIAARFEMSTQVLTEANPGASFAAGITILVPAGPHVYVVRQGDTLASIAGKYGTTVNFLLTGNNLPNPNNIFPGQEIFVPLQIGQTPRPFD